MARYLVYRIGLTVPLLVGALIVVFLTGRLAPGDPVALRLGDSYDAKTAAGIRKDLGLDEPLHVQFSRYVASIVRLDFGESISTPGRRVSAIVSDALPVSLRLTALAIAAAALAGIVLGVFGAVAARTRLDGLIQLSTLLGLSVPNFVVAALLVLVFAVWMGALPVAGLSQWRSYVLPITVLAVPPIAYIARISRTSMLQVLSADYIRTARSKGLASQHVVLRHALRNAAPAIITQVGLSFGYALTGSFVVEVVFNIPGMSRVAVESISRRDYPVIQAAVLIYTFVFIFVNLLVDLSYAFFNPRVRY